MKDSQERFEWDASNRPGSISIWTVIAVCGLVAVAILVLWPSLGRNRSEPRAVCAANLRGIMQAMVVYAADNGGAYPMVAYAPYGTVPNEAKGVSSGTKDFATVVGRSFEAGNPQAGSVQACMWYFAACGSVAPKQFVCKSDPFADGAAAVTDASGNLYTNFQNGKQLSYSMAYPWKADGKVGAWWGKSMDAGTPLMADMTPLQGTGKPARDVVPAREPADGRTWNSGNHAGDGQNVGFGDGHAEFCRRPDIGDGNDNIYSMSGVPSRGPARFGGVAAGTAAPMLMAEKAPFDVVMVPVRNETTGSMK